MQSFIHGIWIFKVFLLFYPIVYIMPEKEHIFFLHNDIHLVPPICSTVTARSKIACAAHCMDLKECCSIASYNNTSRKCQMSKKFVCDTLTQTNGSSTLMVKEENICDQNWKAFNGHCYYFELSVKKSWYNAKNNCQRVGGYLVKIDNECENNWIKAVTKENADGDVWIGINDIATEGQMVSAVDGSKITFSDWSDGEPNNAVDEDCVLIELVNMAWNDMGCEREWYYICEK